MRKVILLALVPVFSVGLAGTAQAADGRVYYKDGVRIETEEMDMKINVQLQPRYEYFDFDEGQGDDTSGTRIRWLIRTCGARGSGRRNRRRIAMRSSLRSFQYSEIQTGVRFVDRRAKSVGPMGLVPNARVAPTSSSRAGSIRTAAPSRTEIIGACPSSPSRTAHERTGPARRRRRRKLRMLGRIG